MGLLSLVLSVVLLGQQCLAQQCSGTVTITGEGGTLTDHSGIGDYQDNTYCVWHIKPANTVASDRISLTWDFFDTEYGFDYVLVKDGPFTNSTTSLFLMGSSQPAPFESSSNSLTIIFVSDRAITRGGFQVQYSVQRCAFGCSGHGVCLGFVCKCDSGWAGVDCSGQNCGTARNCSNHGVCNTTTNICACDVGYYGPDCGNPYCTPSHFMGADSGTFFDHQGGGNYLNNIDCGWTIDPLNSADSVVLNFNRFDLEDDFDFLFIYDGFSEDPQRLLGNFSGHTLPPSVIAPSGTMLVKFVTDQGLTAKGFSATYDSYRCPNGCSGRGLCVGPGTCYCHGGYGGADCSSQFCSNDCHHHGSCDLTTSTCTCDAGWSGLDCGTCVGQNCAAGQNYCSGSVALTNPTGNFGDHEGEGDYQANAQCLWNIAPAATLSGASPTSVLVLLRKVDVTPLSARVRVFDGYNTGAHVIGELSGRYPQLFPVFTSGPAATVQFTSNGSAPDGDGFSASFEALSCPGNCNYRGHCSFNSTCLCQEGYTGSQCQQRVCVGDCGASLYPKRGTCVNDQCVCEEGWFGVDCLQSHCSGKATLTRSYGTFSDHGPGEAYQQNSNCEFEITPPNGEGGIGIGFVRLKLNSASVSVHVDNTEVFNSGTRTFFIVPPLHFDAPSITVKFQSDASFPLEGFQAWYGAAASCPNNCSRNGLCFEETCFCDSGFEGDDCGSAITPPVMTERQVERSDLSLFAWAIYQINIPEDATAGMLHIKVDRENSGGAPFFYVREGAVPTYYVYDQSIPYWLPELEVKRPKAGQTYFVAAFNGDGGSTTVTFSYELRCPDDCGSGICDTGLGECVCEPCHEGLECEIQIDNCTEGGSGFAGWAIAMCVIAILAGLLTAGAIFFYKKQMANSRAFAVQRRALLQEEEGESSSGEGLPNISVEESTGAEDSTEESV